MSLDRTRVDGMSEPARVSGPIGHTEILARVIPHKKKKHRKVIRSWLNNTIRDCRVSTLRLYNHPMARLSCLIRVGCDQRIVLLFIYPSRVLQSRFRLPAIFIYSQWCWQMSNHQIDLGLGEAIVIGGHTVTVHRIDDEGQQAVLEIEDPDGSVEIVTVNVAVLKAAEPVLV